MTGKGCPAAHLGNNSIADEQFPQTGENGCMGLLVRLIGGVATYDEILSLLKKLRRNQSFIIYQSSPCEEYQFQYQYL